MRYRFRMAFKTINPATETLLCRYPYLSGNEVEDALTLAAAGQRRWSRAALADRAGVVGAVGQQLLERRRSLAEIITMEMGKPLREALEEVQKCARACDYYAGNAKRLLADSAVPTESHRSYVVLRPLGIVLAIMPWNFPLWQVVRAAIPALLGGNAVLLKHAPNVPLCALELAQVFRRAGVPPGVFTSLFVDLPTTAALIRDRRVRAVSFTGSTRAGSEVARIAGSAVKPCLLELGGSDPYIVLEDADPERAVDMCVSGRLLNGGQSCISPKRLIVHREVAEEFTERVVERMKRARVGEPMAPATDVGPMARRDLRDQVADQVRQSKGAGARCLLGGEVPSVPGWYYRPTVLAGVLPGMAAYEEEIFGPVAAIIEVESEEEAVRIANDTRYGLGAAIFTRDLKRGERIARESIQAGTCVVNGIVSSDPRLPFGGVKDSGFGRELSRFGVLEFVNVKTVRVDQ